MLLMVIEGECFADRGQLRVLSSREVKSRICGDLQEALECRIGVIMLHFGRVIVKSRREDRTGRWLLPGNAIKWPFLFTGLKIIPKPVHLPSQELRHQSFHFPVANGLENNL